MLRESLPERPEPRLLESLLALRSTQPDLVERLVGLNLMKKAATSHWPFNTAQLNRSNCAAPLA